MYQKFKVKKWVRNFSYLYKWKVGRYEFNKTNSVNLVLIFRDDYTQITKKVQDYHSFSELSLKEIISELDKLSNNSKPILYLKK